MEYENYSNGNGNSIHLTSSIKPKLAFILSLALCVCIFFEHVRFLFMYCAREIPSKMAVFGRNSECEKNNRIQLALQF